MHAAALRSIFEVKVREAETFTIMHVALIGEALEITDSNFCVVIVPLGASHVQTASIDEGHGITVGAVLTIKTPSLAIAEHWVEEMRGHNADRADVLMPQYTESPSTRLANPLPSFKVQGRRIFSFPVRMMGDAVVFGQELPLRDT